MNFRFNESETNQDRRHRGTNQTGVRLYNERLVLSIVRRMGSLPKAEIARMTGLSAQTVSVIVNALETDGLLKKEDKVRGKIGQPSIPISLRDDGAGAFGLKVGRRSAELVAVGLTGSIKGTRRLTYRYPSPQAIIDFVKASTKTLAAQLPNGLADRMAGLGVAMPGLIWKWQDELELKNREMDVWKHTDIQAELAAVLDWPVYLANDATAACGAELIFGNTCGFTDFVYFYLGAFIGGGVVIDGRLLTGKQGNAASLAPILVTANGRSEQLLKEASILALEHEFTANGFDETALWRNPEEWPEAPELLTSWIERTAPAVAQAIVSCAAVIDFEAAIVDGAMPVSVRSALIEAIRREFDALNRVGLSPIEVVEGELGPAARPLGGATLPLLANFIQDHDVLFANPA